MFWQGPSGLYFIDNLTISCVQKQFLLLLAGLFRRKLWLQGSTITSERAVPRRRWLLALSLGLRLSRSPSVPSGGRDQLGASEVASEPIGRVHLRLRHDFRNRLLTLVLEEMAEVAALNRLRLLVEQFH